MCEIIYIVVFDDIWHFDFTTFQMFKNRIAAAVVGKKNVHEIDAGPELYYVLLEILQS